MVKSMTGHFEGQVASIIYKDSGCFGKIKFTQSPYPADLILAENGTTFFLKFTDKENGEIFGIEIQKMGYSDNKNGRKLDIKIFNTDAAELILREVTNFYDFEFTGYQDGEFIHVQDVLEKGIPMPNRPIMESGKGGGGDHEVTQSEVATTANFDFESEI